MNKNYEKPAMNFVNVQSEESVANICWGGNMSAQNLTWAYYGEDHELNGDGPEGVGAWFSFQIDASNCKEATMNNVKIYYHGTAEDGINDSEQQAFLYNGFMKEVNVTNAGSPWKGEGTVTPIISSK